MNDLINKNNIYKSYLMLFSMCFLCKDFKIDNATYVTYKMVFIV